MNNGNFLAWMTGVILWGIFIGFGFWLSRKVTDRMDTAIRDWRGRRIADRVIEEIVF